jgi:hypothetical protein
MKEQDMYIVDRIEDGTAVLEEQQGGRTIFLPTEWLPKGIEEGSILVITLSRGRWRAMLTLTHDEEATRARIAETTRIRDSLTKGPEGDIEL